MSVDESARAYIEKIERQLRTQSSGPSVFIRDTNERARHFSNGARLQSSPAGGVHCEECGQEMSGQSICPGCHASPTRVWLQFVSLGILGVLTAYNYIFVLTLLPRRVPHPHVASVWINVSEFSWHYGWIVLGVYLPAWAYYWRKKYDYRLGFGAQLAIGSVLILLMGAIARPMFPLLEWTWTESLRTTLDSRPELGIVAGWGVVALAFVSICSNCESRDRLLGKGKGLTLFVFTALCVILILTLLAS